MVQTPPPAPPASGCAPPATVRLRGALPLEKLDFEPPSPTDTTIWVDARRGSDTGLGSREAYTRQLKSLLAGCDAELVRDGFLVDAERQPLRER